MRTEDIVIGCCGFPVGIEKYVGVLDAVEIQQTFYRLIPEKTAQNWWQKVTSIKPDFQFAVKAHQFITHRPGSTYAKAGIVIPEEKKGNYGDFKLTEEVLGAWNHTLKIARELHSNTILLQSPPSFNQSPENLANLRNFLAEIRAKDFLIFWEYRGKWSEETVKALCEEFEIYHCVDPTRKKPVSGKYYYFRLHGGERYRHTYTLDELENLASEIKSLDGEKAYVFFNNTSMFNDAQKLRALVK
ncbi:MAG: DUF72 domain-containing protein [Thermoplasmata archaeon]|nr:DUF72 domain-containing protein [Thermoplasmata archaeon]